MLTVWADSLSIVPVQQQRSEDEQSKQDILFKDKPEGVNWSAWLDLTNQPCSTLVIDDGWLLYMAKWELHQTWQEIANSYLSYVQYLGRCSQKIIVVFDGYNRSPKTTTSGVPIPPAVIYRFDRICLTGPQEQSFWTTLITRVSSSNFNLPKTSHDCGAVWQWCWHFNCKRRIGCCFRLLCWGQYHLCL